MPKGSGRGGRTLTSTTTSKTAAKSSGGMNFAGRLVIQPGFAPQIGRLSAPLGVPGPSSFQHGYMIWSEKGGGVNFTGGPLGDGRDVIKFLYNPSTVSSDYQVQMSGVQNTMQYQTKGDNGLYAPLQLQQTVQFQLYFDRTYELNYGYGNGTSTAINDPSVIGCQADVYQFMQFTGITLQAGLDYNEDIAAIGGNAGFQSQVMGSLRQGGVMTMIPSYVFFGNAGSQIAPNPNNGNYNAVGSQLSYYGYVTEWGVEYTHWTVNMVPIRCVISVTYTLMSNTDPTNAAAVWRDNQKLGLAPATVSVPYNYAKPMGG